MGSVLSQIMGVYVPPSHPPAPLDPPRTKRALTPTPVVEKPQEIPLTPIRTESFGGSKPSSFETHSAFKSFKPTRASIPPFNVAYRMNHTTEHAVNHQPLNPLNFIFRAAITHPDKLALIHAEVDTPVFYTYSVWAQRIQNLAYALIQAGIQPGDRVAVISTNSPMMSDAHYGILAARAIITPINTRITPADVSYILSHSGTKFILVDHESAQLVSNVTDIPVVVCSDTGRDGMGDAYEEFLNNGRRFSEERGWAGLESEADENASGSLSYTSGTSGRPKGVIVTLRSLYLSSVGAAIESQINLNTVYLWVLPMFHVTGWMYPWSNVLVMGTQVILRTVSIPQIWTYILEHEVTIYCGAPTVQIGVVNHPGARRPKQKVLTVISGAAPTAKLFNDLESLGITPKHVYGLTEVCGPYTSNYAQPSWNDLSVEDRGKLMARQGHASAAAQEVRVVYPPSENALDSDLKDVPKDGKTIGEVAFRGNMVMKEYYKDPAATKKVFRGGSFLTGDLAVMHPDGAVAIMDRSKDIIISGGENASSLAIETEIATHAHVREVAVIARAHTKWGERPYAFIILHEHFRDHWIGTEDVFTKEIKAHAKKRLPGFACPEWVEVVTDLPKTSTGKIQKVELRKRIANLPLV